MPTPSPFLGIHHVAVICSDIERSRRFYMDVLGMALLAETFRTERGSWKLDLQLPDGSRLELFSFPAAPPRPSYPEARGLRHLALRVTNMNEALAHLKAHGIDIEPVRIDEGTGCRFTFFADPDGLPIEMYEQR